MTSEIEYYNRGLSSGNITLSAVGEQFCKKGHSHGPKIRENYIFHFVVSGKGIFKLHGKTYQLQANQGFLIGDNTPIFYRADNEEPWHYCWIIFSGTQAAEILSKLDLSPENPIYTASPENDVYGKFKTLMRSFANSDDFTVLSDFYAFASELYTSSECLAYNAGANKEEYLRKAEQIILNHYHSPTLRIGKVASQIGIDRSYLTRLFDNVLGVNPQDYLLRLRMEKAKTFLQTTTYSVGMIANSVGYPNIDAFSKMFKRVYGYSPTTARRIKDNKDED